MREVNVRKSLKAIELDFESSMKQTNKQVFVEAYTLIALILFSRLLKSKDTQATGEKQNHSLTSRRIAKELQVI